MSLGRYLPPDSQSWQGGQQEGGGYSFWGMEGVLVVAEQLDGGEE